MTPILPLLFFLAAQQPPAPVAAPPTEPVPAATPASVIDAKAKALLAANAQAMLALKSYAAECWTTYTFTPSEVRPKGGTEYSLSTLTAVKPNRMRYDNWQLTKDANGTLKKESLTPVMTFASDGKIIFRQFGKQYRSDTAVKPRNMHTGMESWEGFYDNLHSINTQFDVKSGRQTEELRLIGQERVEGVLCDVISYRTKSGDLSRSGKLFLGPDKLVRRHRETIAFADKSGFDRDSFLRRIRTNFPPPPPALFAYKPPAGVTKEKPQTEVKRPPLLANGTPAPDFNVEDKDGNPVKLSDFRGKTVILDFWATWCGPCMASMPHTNKVGQMYKDKEVVVVAVNVWDEKAAYKEWLPKHPEYDAITFLLDLNGRKGDVAKTLYNVSGIPTQYVIDKTGVIRASFLGYDDREKDNPLATAVEAAIK